jgi:hypothetical protein
LHKTMWFFSIKHEHSCMSFNNNASFIWILKIFNMHKYHAIFVWTYENQILYKIYTNLWSLVSLWWMNGGVALVSRGTRFDLNKNPTTSVCLRFLYFDLHLLNIVKHFYTCISSSTYFLHYTSCEKWMIIYIVFINVCKCFHCWKYYLYFLL